MTRDCPVGSRAYRKRAAKFAGAALSAILGLFSVSFAQKGEIDEVDGSKQPCTAITTQNVSEYCVGGQVVDVMGAVIPDQLILLYRKDDKTPLRARSDDSGRYEFRGLRSGNHTINVPQNFPWNAVVLSDTMIGVTKTTSIDIELSAEYEEVVGLLAEPTEVVPVGTLPFVEPFP